MYGSAKQEVTKVVSLVQSETKATKFLQSLKLQAFLQYKISRATAFPTIVHVRPAKTKITMHIRALIRIFAVHSMGSQASKASPDGQRRHRLACAG